MPSPRGVDESEQQERELNHSRASSWSYRNCKFSAVRCQENIFARSNEIFPMEIKKKNMGGKKCNKRIIKLKNEGGRNTIKS